MADESPEQRQKMIAAMVDRLAERMQKTPDDVEGWLRLARAYRVMGRLDEAKAAANRAITLRPHEVDPLLALAEVQLAAADEGPLPADFVATMRDILALDGDNGPALYYVGAAEAESGHSDQARRLWSKLLAALPDAAPERAELAKQIESLAKE
jgi:cytochrome c-type biogenesis protein CcmH